MRSPSAHGGYAIALPIKVTFTDAVKSQDGCPSLNVVFSHLSERRITFSQILSMKLKPKITIADHFAVIQDPRIDRTKRHKLIDIMTIAVCAVICGADGWVGIET